MKKILFSCILFFLAYIMIVGTDHTLQYLSKHRFYELSFMDERFRKMDFTNINIDTAKEAANTCGLTLYELIITSMYDDISIKPDITWDSNYIIHRRNQLIRKYGDLSHFTRIIEAIMEDIKIFPVAASTNKLPFVEFSNSWMFERTFGGKRAHEGCDIMALANKSGIYPIVSVSEGIVENMGWLEKGGYRVGVRSSNGIYYYYAHLAMYSDIKVGDTVSPGDLLGFMGDTGYGPEGTTGMFDVHLHFGIYITDEDGNEISVNPYWFMLFVFNKVLYIDYWM